MIIILLVINVIGRFPYPQFNKEQEISLYPTVGEFYQYYLSLQQDYQLMCKMHPKVPHVQIINQCEEIYETKGNQFTSMSSNNTHFGTLSNENEVIIYEWKNSMIQQVGQSVPIDSSFNCFNINLSLEFSILVDCYYNNEFFLIQLIDAQSIIAYSIQSTLPTQTKIQSILNGTNAFIVYAQYFKKYSILSLFSSQFLNLSSLNNQFVDFDIPITISPNIYAITSQQIYQLSISPDSQFYYKYNFSQQHMSNFSTINVYYNLFSYSQCDQIQVSYLFLSQKMTGLLMGCENMIQKVGFGLNTLSGQPIQKILQSDQFVIQQSIDQIWIKQQKTKEQFQYNLNIQNNSLLYFNQDNELFSFNQDIIVYKITYPFLQINLTNLESVGNNYTFQMICQNKGSQNCTYNYSNFYLQVLPQNDTNIYVMLNQDFQQYQTSFNYNISYFYSFSGQLLNYTQNQNEAYFNAQQTTFQNVGETIQSYQLVSFLSINYPSFNKQFLIGYGNSQLNVLLCIQNSQTHLYDLSTLSQINFSENVSSLQVAFSIYPQIIIIGLSSTDTIYLFQCQNGSIIQTNYTFQQQFSDFVITYNSIIILFPNQEIQILTFNYTNTFTLNQSSINKFFNNIQFNPIQIVINTQLQSSFLYINNINEVIIISIDQNSFPIPISLIHVNFTIKQINLVSQQLILSYLCNNQQNVCFQVWNVQNLPKYYYVKNLYSVNFDNNIMIQSDNLFFYVTFSNYTVYVYNPLLPYQMSLYYELELNSSIQCSELLYLSQNYFNEESIIISNNNLYVLFGIQSVNPIYQQQNQDFNNSISYPLFIYNYTVTSALNETAFYQTPNQSISLYSNFTILQSQRYLFIQLTKDNIIPLSKNFTYPMNLILDRQVGYCGFPNQNQTGELNKYCSLTQFSLKSSSIPNIQNYSLITAINNEYFALQNQFYIQTVKSDLNNLSNFNYSYLNLNECLESTSYNYILYSICSNSTSNSTSQYLLNFTLDFQGKIVYLNTTQITQTINIYKIRIVLNQIFVIGNEQNLQQQLYWFNQSAKEFQNISNACNDFSIQLIKFKDNQSQQIIIFYVWASQVNYTIMSINDQGVKLQDSVIVNIYYCNQLSICFEDEQYYLQILIIQTFSNGAIILLSNSYFSFIVNIIIMQFQIQSQNTQEGRIIKTIPNYGNINSTIYSYFQNGVLMQQFPIQNYQNQFIVGVYYLNNLLDENLFEPILMQGSFNTTNSNYSMIINQEYQNGTSLYIYNQSIQNYYISTWQVNCLIYNTMINVSIFCQNEFSNGSYIITFVLPSHFRINFGPSAYVLMSLIFLLLLYFYIKVKYKTRNLEYISSEIEL